MRHILTSHLVRHRGISRSWSWHGEAPVASEATHTPLRVLYVADVGQHLNTIKADVKADFAAFGTVEEAEFVVNKRFGFVVFKYTHSTAAAKGSHSALIQHAVENAPRSPGPLQPDCLSLTAEVLVLGLCWRRSSPRRMSIQCLATSTPGRIAHTGRSS